MGQRVSAGDDTHVGSVGLEPSKWSGRTIRHPRPRNNGRAAEIAAHNSPRDTWLRILTSPLHPRTICYPATASTTDILWSPVPVGIGRISAWNCLTNRNGVPFLVYYTVNGESSSNLEFVSFVLPNHSFTSTINYLTNGCFDTISSSAGTIQLLVGLKSFPIFNNLF